jgi:hypothetical protein
VSRMHSEELGARAGTTGPAGPDVQRLWALVDAGVFMSGDLKLDAVLDRICQTAAGVIGARYAAIGVLDESGEGLSNFVFHGRRWKSVVKEPTTAPRFEDAFDGLFDRAFSVAFRVLGDATSAEDVAAEACARAFASWKRLAGASYRDAWVLRVASNLAVDVLRRRAQPLMEQKEVSGSLEDAVALRMALAAALRALPRRQRETVVLRHWPA